MSADASTPGLYWSIKRAFVLYVARIADGQILGSPGLRMTDSSTFVWAPATPPNRASPDIDASFAFEGSVVFGAHAGALAFRVADPAVELSRDRSLLTIAGESGSRIPFVAFAAARAESGAGLMVWTGTEVRLTEEALPLFAGYYGVDEPFDDLRIVLSSG